MYATKFKFIGNMEGVEIHVFHKDSETAIQSNNQEFIEQFLIQNAPDLESDDIDHELGFMNDSNWCTHKFIESSIYKLPEKSVTPTEDFYAVHLCLDDLD